MLRNIDDLPLKSRMFAEHCLDNMNLNEVVEMIYSKGEDHLRTQFELSEDQWQDAVYVVIKEMGQGTNTNM